MVIVPGVHLIPIATPTFVMGMYPTNVYAIVAGKTALIDAGHTDEEAIGKMLEYIRNLAPPRLEYILLTHPHPDHAGGCSKIKEATGAKIVVHSTGTAHLEPYGVKADVIVHDGDALDIGGIMLKVIHTPGHTADSVCFYMQERRILFTGDHILGLGTPVISRISGDMAQYIKSLERLLKYPIRLICPGHGPPVREPHRKIKELISHRKEREQQILSSLRYGRKSLTELVAEIYPELDQRLVELAKSQVTAHLKKLVEEDKVSVSGEEYTFR